MNDELIAVASGTGYRHATFGNAIIGAFNGTVDAETGPNLRRSLLRHADSHPDGVVAIVHVLEGTARPDGEARQGLTAMMSAVDSKVIAWGLIFEGVGFWAAAMRAIQSTILLAARIGAPAKVFDDPAAASEWVQSTLGERLSCTSADLQEAIETVRAELERQ